MFKTAIALIENYTPMNRFIRYQNAFTSNFHAIPSAKVSLYASGFFSLIYDLYFRKFPTVTALHYLLFSTICGYCIDKNRENTIRRLFFRVFSTGNH